MEPFSLILSAAALAVAMSSGGKKYGKKRAIQKVNSDGVLTNPSESMKAIDMHPEMWPELVFDIPFGAGDPYPVWPIETEHSRKFDVSYKTATNKMVANGARRFMVKRSPEHVNYHVGIDLYGSHGDKILSMEDGEITNFYHFYAGTYALFVQCKSGLVINYGEVERNSWKEFGLGKGSKVKKGQPIARVGLMDGGSSMLHFETYMRPTKTNKRYPGGNPGPILNPTYYLLRSKFVNENPKGASFSSVRCEAPGMGTETIIDITLPDLSYVISQEHKMRDDVKDSVMSEILYEAINPDPLNRADGP